MARVVIVGASLAGLRAAQALRRAGHEGELVVVGDEEHLPYTRPPLSKELLTGRQEAEACAFPSAIPDVQWRLGTAAARLDRGAHTVTLADGEIIGYDRLIIATGRRARQWPGTGAELVGVHTLRTLDDALALRDALEDRPRLAVVGAGFIGCEVAASARARGLDVTLVDAAPQPMLPLGPELGARCAGLHVEHGVDLRLGQGVVGLAGTDGRVTGIELADATTVAAEVVLVALGAIPNSEWLADSGLALDRGSVLCDSTLTSVSDPDVLAAGDVAAWPHPLAGGEVVRVEHWTTAAEHGTQAGRNAAAPHEERAPHVTPPYFWSDQHGTKIQAVGFPTRADRIQIVDDEGARLVAEAHGADGRLLGAIAFNNAKRLAGLRRQLATEAVAA